MKNWFSSSLLWAYSSVAMASPIDSAYACLEVVDLLCAQRIRDSQMALHPQARAVQELNMRILFHEGRYGELLSLLEAFGSSGESIDDTGQYPMLATVEAAEGMMNSKGEGVEVRHDPGIDRILSSEGIDVLEASRSVYDPLFGGGPDHDIVLDIFPTAKRFIMASGLPPESVRTTGVIALSKWNRLLLTSPRSTSRGYAWKDTVAHEYIHLVVAWRSEDNAPVWLQEGLAKYLEGAWRGERKKYLSAHQMSLLAEAIREDSFVPFEKFARSMAYLDSSEEAALAFAQVATMVGFLQSLVGDTVFNSLMEKLKAGATAEEAVSELAGYTQFDDFIHAWKIYIQGLPLIQEELAALPINLDGSGGDFEDDPLLGIRQDLAKYARLGDLLLEAERPKAALIEYEKAIDEDAPPSPSIFARRAQCNQVLGKTDLSLSLVEEGIRLYPEFPLLLKTAGDIHSDLNQPQTAVIYYRAAHDINPYQPEIQQALIQHYETLGKSEDALHHREIAEILSTGGARRTITNGE